MMLLFLLGGVLLFGPGLVLLMRSRRLLGGLLMLAGTALVACGAVALLSFHP